MIQTEKIKIGDPSNAAISAGRIKIPEPIMVVMTRAVAVDSPMVRLKSWCCGIKASKIVKDVKAECFLLNSTYL